MGINVKVSSCLLSALACSNLLRTTSSLNMALFPVQTTHIGASQTQVTQQQIRKVEQTAQIDVSAHSFSHLQVDIPVLHLCIAFMTLGPHPL